MSWVRKVLRRALTAGLDRIPTARLEAVIRRLVEYRASRLSADESLRFLFRLDERLYKLQGQKAIEYGGGVHTKHRHIRYHDFFVNRIRPGERVLDIGCGNGALAYDVAERAGANVWGIDLNAANIRTANQRFAHPNVRYVVGDALRDLSGEGFDVAILSNLLEHVADRVAFLRHVTETAQVSRVLIRVPLFERDWRVPLKRELGVEWRLDTTHETEHTLESFAQEITAAGLDIGHQEVRWGEILAEATPANEQQAREAPGVGQAARGSRN